jgi:hypothetical protein
MNAGSTIDQLIKEISSFINEDKDILRLEVEGAFELREKESVFISFLTPILTRVQSY